jgi:tetratricopeptide (TPR) repeat protein
MQRAYRQDSSSADYYYYYAFLYKHLNIPDSSIHYFGECINRNASYSLAYFNRGLLYGNKGNYEGALNDFEQYISKAPGDPNAYFYYGQALCITGNAGKGCEYLKEADKRGVKEAQEKINYYCR